MAKLKFVDDVLRNPKYTQEEKKDALLFEDFLHNIVVLALKEVDELSYQTVLELEPKYTFLENLLADNLPTNVAIDLQFKVLGALSQVFKTDLIRTADQTLPLDLGIIGSGRISGPRSSFDLGGLIKMQSEEIVVEKADVESDLTHLRKFYIGQTFKSKNVFAPSAKVTGIMYVEELGSTLITFESDGETDTVPLTAFRDAYTVPFVGRKDGKSEE